MKRIYAALLLASLFLLFGVRFHTERALADNGSAAIAAVGSGASSGALGSCAGC